MKLTNESLAKLLGWKKVKAPLSHMLALKGDPFAWRRPNEHESNSYSVINLPNFLTDLNEIVKAIEGLDLKWAVGWSRKTKSFHAAVGKGPICRKHKTGCLALATALGEYLRRKG